MALSPQPPAPSREFSFTDWQVANPTAPPPGDKLDGEYDRADGSIAATIAWVASSLNTDGTLRAGTVGTSQLVSGLFEDVAQDIIDEVQPLVDSAAAYAASAAASAGGADASAGEAETANVAAQVAKVTAEAASAAADLARMDANSSALTAGSKATDAANAANHAAGDAALAEDWGIVARDWAEHMPDTIPPNTLAVMGVTGDHWSSRWWANKAASYLGGMFAELYLGAWPAPPPSTSTGGPLVPGMIYYNTVAGQPYVWNGTEWVPFYAPTKAYMLTLAYLATAGQTVIVLTTPDMAANSYTLSNTVPEPLDLYVNGVRLPASASTGGAGDWSVDHATSTVTLTAPLKAGDLVQIDVLAPASSIAPSRVQTQALLDFDIDPATDLPGQIDGSRTTFPLVLAAPPHDPVGVGSAQELFVSLDGVVQQPGLDYNVGGGNIIFSEAPMVGARAWASWYGPGVGGSGPGTGYLPLTGGVLTGPLTLAGPPTIGLHAATKAYVDGQSLVLATGTADARSVQDRFADELNVLDFFPGTYTSGTDISDALIAALATGKNVWMPGGYTYRIREQIVVGVNGNTPQRLRGDGKSTYIIIEPTFAAAATGIVKLMGAEANAPTLQDMHVAFAQPVAATSRADFVTLGTPGAGTGLLGVKYPPAVLIGAGCNRFIIDNVRFSNCWDGIHQEDGTVSTGGWWLKNIEISVYNIGLKLGKNKDFGHIQGWHHWSFNMTAANSLVMQDGGTFAMQFGIGGETEGVTGDNVNIWSGRVLVNNSTGWLHFSSLMMDAANSTLEHVQCQFTQISNLYFAGTPNGLNPNSQIQMSGGTLHIVNMFAFSGRTMITQTAGRLSVLNGSVNALTKDVGILEHSGGFCSLARLYINANVASGAWTQPLVRSTNANGGLSFQHNTIIAPSVGDVGAVSLIDHATNVVINNTFNGWSFTPPGTAGAYQTGSNFYTKSVTAGGITVGGVASATTNVRLNATGQKAVEWYNASSIRWAAGPFTGPADDWVLNRYNDAGVFQGTALSVNRATGVVTVGQGFAATTFTAGANFGAQLGGSLSDLSKHIAIHTGGYGINMSSGRMNLIGPSGAGVQFIMNGTNQLNVTETSATFLVPIVVNTSGPTIRSGTGAATGTQPKGSLWLRTDGAAGSTIYVSQGAGAWNAVAGV